MKIAVIMPTLNCQMQCEFCINELSMQSFNSNDIENIKSILEQESFQSVVIGGGEPLLWKYGLFQFINEIQNKNYAIQVGTNGILLEDDFWQNQKINRWVFPLESTHEDIHNRMRPSRVNHHNLILQRIAKLQFKPNALTISTVITKRNQNNILSLALYLKDFHLKGDSPIHAWHLYQFIPKGRGGEFSKDLLQIPDTDYEGLFQEVKQLNLPFKVYKRKNMLNSKTVTFFWKENNQIQRS